MTLISDKEAKEKKQRARMRSVLVAERTAIADENKQLGAILHDIDNTYVMLHAASAQLVKIVDKNNKRVSGLQLELASLFDPLI